MAMTATEIMRLPFSHSQYRKGTRNGSGFVKPTEGRGTHDAVGNSCLMTSQVSGVEDKKIRDVKKWKGRLEYRSAYYIGEGWL